jgi:hypothetical protein
MTHSELMMEHSKLLMTYCAHRNQLPTINPPEFNLVHKKGGFTGECMTKL